MQRPDPSIVRVEGQWTHRDVSANGIRLHVAEAGSGPLVLLLHGFGELWWVWHRQLLELAESGFRAVAADLRGYGDSDKPPRGYDAWTLAGDVAGLIRALGERKAHLVGHAWGGMLALTTANLHPRLVASVSTLGSAHPLALRSSIRRTVLRGKSANQARALGHLFRFQWPMAPERWLVRDEGAAIRHLFYEWSGPNWRESNKFDEITAFSRKAMLIPGVAHSALEYYRWAFRAQFRGEGRRFSDAVGARITTPALQIHGELDPCILPKTAQESEQWLGRDTQFITLPKIGHFPHLESPNPTKRALLNFLCR